MTTTSVVVRTLNEGRHLGRLLEGLERQTVRPTEVIVVDSGSTDDTVAVAEKWGAKVVYIAKEQFSFGRSLNVGCDAATGDVLILMSAHVYPVYDSYVEHMMSRFGSDAVAVVYGRQVGDGRTKFSESRVLLKWFPEESIWDQGHPFSNNANAAVRRSVWEELRYDEDLTGLEDLEFAHRAQNAGWSLSYVAEAPVVHVHEESWSTIRNRYRRESIAYAKITGEERMSVVDAVRLAVANAASDYWHATREGRLRGNLLGIPAFRAAQFVGAYEGFRTHVPMTDELRRRFYYPTDLSRRGTTEEPGRRIEYTDGDL